MSPWISTPVSLLILWGLLQLLDYFCRRGESLFAVTGVMITEVWRRRLLPVSGILLLIGLTLLPLVLAVDPVEPEGRRTLLQYGQGWISLVILTSILVMSCSTLSEERSSETEIDRAGASKRQKGQS